MNIRRRSSNVQGKFPQAKPGKRYLQTLAALFHEGTKMAGGDALGVAKTLDDNGIDAVFVGGIVVGCHTGRPRATKDIDVIIAADTVSAKVLKQLGTIVKSQRVERHPSFLSFIVDSVVGDQEVLDLITSKAGSFGMVFANAQSITVGLQSLKIPTVEMMVVLKYTAAINPVRSKSKQLQDWSDIYGMLDANPDIDKDAIRVMANNVVPGFGDDLYAKIREHQR